MFEGFFPRNTNLFITLNLVADKGKEIVSVHTVFQAVKASWYFTEFWLKKLRHVSMIFLLENTLNEEDKYWGNCLQEGQIVTK